MEENKTTVKIDAWGEDSLLKEEVKMTKVKSVSSHFGLDVDKMIDSILDELCDPEKNETKEFEETIGQLSVQVKSIERKQREINKIFADCTDELQRFRESLEESEREEEMQYNQAAEAAAKAAKAQKIQDEKSDSDDEVQFIESTFDPSLVKRRMSPARTPSITSKLTPVMPSSPREIIVPVPQIKQQERPTLDVLRKALTASINKQMISNTADSQAVVGQAASAQPKPPTSQFITARVASELTAKTNQAYMEEYKDIGPGSSVLAKKANEIWHKAIVVEIPNLGQPLSERKFKVKFDSKMSKVLTGKLISFGSSIVRPVSVGSRVAALYKEEDESPTSFYAGIVAEAPNGRNNHRYLIFFEDGYAQYCLSSEIHKVLYQCDEVWEDIPPDSKEFIKEYLKQYPERPMVRLNRGQTIKTEWNGRWWSARVIEVDASLAKMFFAADKRVEWIYRGSTRLEPLYTALASAEANKMTGKLKRHNLNAQNKKAVVEYTRGIEDKQKASVEADDAAEAINQQMQSDTIDQKKRPVARKSTGGATKANSESLWEAPWLRIKRKTPAQLHKEQEIQAPFPVQGQILGQGHVQGQVQSADEGKEPFQASSISSNTTAKDMASVLQTRLATAEEGDIDEEHLGERVDNVVPLIEAIRKKIIPHECGEHCLKDAGDDSSKFKGQNPLILPMLCGWERHVCKLKPTGKRLVLYRTPCGRRLRNIEETCLFLMLTESKLTVDYFCFDPFLHTHTEFVPVKTFCDIKDLSYGKENVAISCVNGIDRQYPDYVEYSNQRIPAKGVKLNLDTEFLVGCSCIDYCQTNCACQQKTVEATTWGNTANKFDTKAGYKNRRLEEPILTGVFECNSKCKCSSKCHNRVAQNGLQVRLQVFKTEKRGWGLRCLNDIPCGGFICIYAGQLLTEQGANEDGQQYGDEYLAELDYMEVVETHKEGYESDADSDEGVGDSDDESEDENNSNISDSTFSADDAGKDTEGAGNRTHGTRSIKIHSTTSMAKTAGWLESLASDPIIIGDDDDDSLIGKGDNQTIGCGDVVKADSQKAPVADLDDELPDLEPAPEIVQEEKNIVPPMNRSLPILSPPTRARRSGTTKTSSRFKNLPDPKKLEHTAENNEAKTVKEEKPGSRRFFGGEECIYIMDAKSMGNIGRYLNHSCNPNVFVQNVFVDTHDLRFPWVAFFAGQFIRAGTELTWDYNYEVGSVPGKILYCYCGSAECRGRLL